MKRTMLFLMGGVLMLNSCGLYKEYQSTASVPTDVYGEAKVDTVGNIAVTQWQQMFTDTQLQKLILTALTNNNDIKTARMRIEQAEISYKTANLAYLPTVAFSPSANISKYGSASTETTFSLGVAANWQLDVFGAGITNAKRKAKANVAYAKDYEQALQCRLVSSVAQLYYQLLGLDQQLKIQKEMVTLYETTYESVQTLFETGQYTSPAVHQTKAQLESLKISILSLENAIENVEHSMCKLLDEPQHKVDRGVLADVTLPTSVAIGIPADLLRNRPDVRAAERNMEMAYYSMLQAKGALYPAITLTANGGWTKLSSSNGLLDPKVWFINGIGSLVQPIFQGGKLRANLKASKIDQQIALNEFRQTVIDAGHEVTTALSACQLAKAKAPHIQAQVESLKEAVLATQELMNNGTTSYLEVLTSLQDLLQAELTAVSTKTDGAMALVQLYAALGGGAGVQTTD